MNTPPRSLHYTPSLPLSISTGAAEKNVYDGYAHPLPRGLPGALQARTRVGDARVGRRVRAGPGAASAG